MIDAADAGEIDDVTRDEVVPRGDAILVRRCARNADAHSARSMAGAGSWEERAAASPDWLGKDAGRVLGGDRSLDVSI